MGHSSFRSPLEGLEPCLVKPSCFNPGDKTAIEPEARVENLKFKVHSFTKRVMPADRSEVVFFPNFCEFGSELVASLYCIPAILARKHAGRYSVVVGWQGRHVLYRHLVDEYWELAEDSHWLREYSRAFHHASANLRGVEAKLAEHGVVVPMNDYAVHTAMPRIPTCWRQGCGGTMRSDDQSQTCVTCGWHVDPIGIYHDLRAARSRAVWPAAASAEALEAIAPFVRENGVGVTARARKCYGRNLPMEYYANLALKLEDMGYRPVWIGEKETTLPAPFSWIPDFSRHEMGSDLEKTLALVSTLKFTVQYWTASTRLAGLVGTPFLLFESPDQVWGGGHEGMRLKLCSRGPHKVVAANYCQVEADHRLGLEATVRAIRQMESGDWDDLVGPVADFEETEKIRRVSVSSCRWY